MVFINLNLPRTRKEAKVSGSKTYYTGNPCVRGHVSQRRTDNGVCCQCMCENSHRYKQKNKQGIAEKRKVYISQNRDKINKKDKEYRRKNRDRIIKRRRELNVINKEENQAYSKDYYQRNKERFREERRSYYREYMRERRKCPEFKAKTRMRDMLRRVLSKTKRNKNSRTEEELGYTHFELKNHVESLFIEGMSWDNHGEWHLDHIKSIKAFIDEGVTDPKVINALSNLQPLWAKDNITKGA